MCVDIIAVTVINSSIFINIIGFIIVIAWGSVRRSILII